MTGFKDQPPLMAWYIMFLRLLQRMWDGYGVIRLVVGNWLSRKSILTHNNRISLLDYRDGSQEYTIAFPRVRGPAKFTHVVGSTSSAPGQGPGAEGNEVVTDIIKKFAGPSHNFHGIPTTPSMLGFQFLTFHYRNGDARWFDRDDVIDCNPQNNRLGRTE
jgi:hypothetical protein